MTTSDAEAVEACEFAHEIGLSYGFDDRPGIRRRAHGTGFSYVAASGRKVSAPERARCEQLAVPPAWTDVWISADPDNHVVATGVDDAGRKQYLYHERWREARDLHKFARLGEFADGVVDIRRSVSSDIETEALSRTRVLAAVVRLLDQTLVRVGSERYAVDNETFGLTTLERRHVRRAGSAYEFAFTAKSGIERRITVVDPRCGEVIEECRGIRHAQLFCFRSGDRIIDVTAEHVNDYLTDVAGSAATAKTFRTWGATVRATEVLAGHLDDDEIAERAESWQLEAVDSAAEALGNTRAVCRSCYVAPQVLTSLDDGRLRSAWQASRAGRWRSRAESAAAKLLR